jgi:hypothetical protein
MNPYQFCAKIINYSRGMFRDKSAQRLARTLAVNARVKQIESCLQRRDYRFHLRESVEFGKARNSRELWRNIFQNYVHFNPPTQYFTPFVHCRVHFEVNCAQLSHTETWMCCVMNKQFRILTLVKMRDIAKVNGSLILIIVSRPAVPYLLSLPYHLIRLFIYEYPFLFITPCPSLKKAFFLIFLS